MNRRDGGTSTVARQLWYVPWLALAMALLLLRTLLLARLLEVPQFAQLGVAMLISATFCMLACLGLQLVLQRDLPVMLVRGRHRAGAVLVAQNLVVATGCLLACALLAGLGLQPRASTPALTLVALLHGWAAQLFLVVTVESRSRGEPLRFALQNLARALAVFGGGALVAVAGGSALAVTLAEATATLALAAWMLSAVLRRAALRAAVAFALARRRLRAVRWRSALALLLVNAVGFVLLSGDRWWAAEALPASGFALYAFAWTILMLAHAVQSLVSASVFPMLARHAARHPLPLTFRRCATVSLGLLGGCAVLGWPLALLLDAGLERWFVRYVDARPLLPLFLAIAALRVSDFWTGFLIVAGRERRLLALNIVSGVVGLAAWVAWLQPWQGGRAPQPWDFGWLAALLTVGNWVTVALAAWRASRR